MDKKLTEKEFTMLAMAKLIKINPKTKRPYAGIHSVYSGYNEAFRKYFPNSDPVTCTTQLAKEGLIQVEPFKGGVFLYLPGKAPVKRVDATLSAILG